jgi:hypothetical protein
MKVSKFLLGLGVAIAIIALAMPASLAQCPASREFGGQGNGSLTGRIKIDDDTNDFPNDGNEFASVWDTVNGAGLFGSGDHIASNPGACPSSGWYVTGGMFLGTLSGIQGFVGTAGCFPVQCPQPNVGFATLVEDVTGDGTNAGFILYNVDASFANIRPYDHARTAGIGDVGGAQATQIFQPYPTVDTTGSFGPPPNTTVTNSYLDLLLNFHGADTTAAGSSAIVSYDIVAHHGPAAPGSNRGDYNMGTIRSVAYEDLGVVGDEVLVPCPTEADDTFLAVGASFRNGPLAPIESLLVGQPTAVECDPNIAEPQPRLERRNRKGMSRAGR